MSSSSSTAPPGGKLDLDMEKISAAGACDPGFGFSSALAPGGEMGNTGGFGGGQHHQQPSGRSVSRSPNLQLSVNLVADNIPVQVAPRIFVGSIHSAFNQSALLEFNITHIVNAAGLPATFPTLFSYLTITLRDRDSSNLLSCIPAANIFIEAALQGSGCVLVHCTAGKSRSIALVVAYLISSRGFSFDKALDIVREKRSVVSINTGFERQLRAYALVGCDVYSAHQELLRQRIEYLSVYSPESVVEMGKAKAGGARSILNPQAKSSSSTPVFAPVQRPARLRLQRPGSQAVQIVPPLRSMDLEFVCCECSGILFYSGSILQPIQGSRVKLPDLEQDESAQAADGLALASLSLDSEDGDFMASLVPPTPSLRRSGPSSPKRAQQIVSFESKEGKEDDKPPRLKVKLRSARKSSSEWIPSTRPCSREKARWLERWREFESSDSLDAEGEEEDEEEEKGGEKKEKESTTRQKMKKRQSKHVDAIAAADEATTEVLQRKHVFVEPLRWMVDSVGRHGCRGDLSCHACDARIGTYDWDGMETDWGEMVSPGFRIESKRVYSRERPPTSSGRRKNR